jgi:hypothetical protein
MGAMPEDPQISEHDDLSQEEQEEQAAFDSEEASEEESKEEADVEVEEEVEEEEKPDEDSENELEEGSDEEAPDEDVKRGKELREKWEQEEEQRKEKEAKDAEQARQAEAKRKAEEASRTPLSVDDLKLFRDVVPIETLPDAVEVDGKEINLKSYVEDFPEASVMSSYAAKAVVDRLVENQILMTTESHKQALQDVEARFANEVFRLRVESKVEDVSGIYNSDDFQSWFKQAPGEIRALFDSSDPNDHVRVFNRFIKESGKDEADKKKTEANNKAREKKEKRDSIYKTPKKKSGGKDRAAMTPEEEEQQAFESEDE